MSCWLASSAGGALHHVSARSARRRLSLNFRSQPVWLAWHAFQSLRASRPRKGIAFASPRTWRHLSCRFCTVPPSMPSQGAGHGRRLESLLACWVSTGPDSLGCRVVGSQQKYSHTPCLQDCPAFGCRTLACCAAARPTPGALHGEQRRQLLEIVSRKAAARFHPAPPASGSQRSCHEVVSDISRALEGGCIWGASSGQVLLRAD